MQRNVIFEYHRAVKLSEHLIVLLVDQHNISYINYWVNLIVCILLITEADVSP